ncbi:MAG: AlpA family phage regulatory protein [Candidatus Hydrogenedentes bacterium]|nr:AlpA family phage regulatory protein [Candidatus Hydrogenedentota bacterium]
MTDFTMSIKPEFDAQVTAALMIQSNALIPVKLAARLCGISRQEIDRRVHNGTFPKPHKLSGNRSSMRKAFYLRDIHDWIRDPKGYRRVDEQQSTGNLGDGDDYQHLE